MIFTFFTSRSAGDDVLRFMHAYKSLNFELLQMVC
jgi:hypothetical protein